MVFCNKEGAEVIDEEKTVTILILIDGFLQFLFLMKLERGLICHNPYFNRWFSAISKRAIY